MVRVVATAGLWPLHRTVESGYMSMTIPEDVQRDIAAQFPYDESEFPMLEMVSDKLAFECLSLLLRIVLLPRKSSSFQMLSGPIRRKEKNMAINHWSRARFS